MKRIAYLNGRTYRGKPIAPGQTPATEAPDYKLMLAAGARHGLRFELRYWDDPELPHAGYDAAIIRSCWDYHQRLDLFIETLEGHERAGLRIFNSPEIVRWNVRKTYLRDLGDAAIDTIWVDVADAETIARAFDALDADELVVKPQIGAGSIGTMRLKRGAWRAEDVANGPNGAAMIQPFLKQIETEGERSLFWFGGVFSHAIRKVPHAGNWLANMPGQTSFIADAPPRIALEVAEAARARTPKDLLYVRIDLVLGNDGRWRVIEIEAIEPHLFLAFAPGGADAFAGALSSVLSG